MTALAVGDRIDIRLRSQLIAELERILGVDTLRARHLVDGAMNDHEVTPTLLALLAGVEPPAALGPTCERPRRAARSSYAESCSRKVRYPSSLAAELVGERRSRMEKRELFVYRCAACSGWHLTKARQTQQR